MAQIKEDQLIWEAYNSYPGITIEPCYLDPLIFRKAHLPHLPPTRSFIIIDSKIAEMLIASGDFIKVDDFTIIYYGAHCHAFMHVTNTKNKSWCIYPKNNSTKNGQPLSSVANENIEQIVHSLTHFTVYKQYLDSLKSKHNLDLDI